MATPMNNVGDDNADNKWTFTSENSVQIRIDETHITPGKTKTFFNPKKRVCRELILCALGVLSKEKEKAVRCLDAFGATGVSGLQWKKAFTGSVDVTINDKAGSCAEHIRENCARNNIEVKGQEVKGDNVEVTNKDANVLLHEQQFDFIYLDPYGSTVHFLDAAFANIMNQGIMILTSTDVSSLYGKCPNVLRRNYGAHTIKTEYYKETAVRIVIGAALRAAAKCNKGIEVLYAVAVEHYVSVALRIKRGPSHADSCITKYQKLIHCQFCHERAFYSDTKAPIDNPYKFLKCSCNDNQLGKTALELGPMWCGRIFKPSFLKNMLQTAYDQKLSTSVTQLLQTLISEATCLDHSTSTCLSKSSISQSSECTPEVASVVESSKGTPEVATVVESSKSTPEVASVVEPQSCDKQGEKRQLGDASLNGSAKKFKVDDEDVDSTEEPAFYWNINHRKLTRVDPPKKGKLVNILRQEKFRASLTHFDSVSIRTNASLQEFTNILNKHCTSRN